MNSKQALTDIISTFHGDDYILQEALTGKQEPIIHFIAYKGRLLATACFVHSENEALFVAGVGKYNLHGGKVVNCTHLDKISPLGDVTRRIISKSGYNGFGCINFKYVPQTSSRLTSADVDLLLDQLPKVPSQPPDSPSTEFGSADAASRWAEYEAVPKASAF